MPEGHEDEDEKDDFEKVYETGRDTAPHGPYTMRDVGVGFAVALVGLLVTFGVPLLLT